MLPGKQNGLRCVRVRDEAVAKYNHIFHIFRMASIRITGDYNRVFFQKQHLHALRNICFIRITMSRTINP